MSVKRKVAGIGGKVPVKAILGFILFIVGMGMVIGGLNASFPLVSFFGVLVVAIGLVIVFVIPERVALMAFDKYISDHNLPILSHTDFAKQFVDIFSHANPYGEGNLPVIQKVDRLVQLLSGMKVFVNTRIIFFSGSSQIRLQFCFLFQAPVVENYLQIVLINFPYIKEASIRGLNLLASMVKFPIYNVKTGITEIDENYLISSKDPQEASRVVAKAQDELKRISKDFLSLSIPRMIDYDSYEQMRIDINGGYCLVRFNLESAKYVEQICPIVGDLRQALTRA